MELSYQIMSFLSPLDLKHTEPQADITNLIPVVYNTNKIVAIPSNNMQIAHTRSYIIMGQAWGNTMRD